MHAGVFEDPTAPRLRYPKVFATWRYHADPYRLSTIGVSETSVFLLIQDGVFVRRMNQNNSCMFLMRSLFRYISRVPWYISSTVCCWYRSIFWTLQQSSTQLDIEKRKLGLFLQRAKLQGQTQQSRDARKDGLAAPFLQRHSTPKIQTQKAATYWFRIGFVLKRLESKVTSRLRLSRIIAYYSVL